jgi:inhibitor of cysteine peptidase
MIKSNFIKKIKTKSVILLFIILIVLLVFSGCMIAGKTLTESDNGENLNLKVNDVITIELESNITTGYKWNLSNETDINIITLISSDYKTANTKETLVGGGGYETFNFKVNSKGSTTIILTYNRPWEKGEEPAKTYKINIVVE